MFSSAFKLNVVFSLIFNSLLAADSLLVCYSAKVPGKERVLEQTYGRSGDEFSRRMNILSLVVHGQKEAPDLGALTRKTNLKYLLIYNRIFIVICFNTLTSKSQLIP